MPNYAWCYIDHNADICYWCYSNEMSATDFAARVSEEVGERVTASDISAASNDKDLDRHLRIADSSVHL